MARKSAKTAERFSSLVVQLIEAAEHAGKDAEGSDIRGAARALRDFARLASWALPIHGVFVPNNSDVALIIQRIAKEHLDWEEARSEVRAALSAVQTFEARDTIETAENHLRAVSDEAYFYAGLAFGVTFACPPKGSSRVG